LHLHAATHFDVFCAVVVASATVGVTPAEANFDESPNGLLAEDVSGTSTHVSLFVMVHV
jgi:hypothetical protein